LSLLVLLLGYFPPVLESFPDLGALIQAPGHGEDDYRVCMAHGVITKGGNLPCPVDLEGRFHSVITDFAGK
jgi:isoleucyl-tRNA synthetase